MTGIEIIFSCLVAFLFSTGLTWTTRIFAIRRSILDIPNERSSHLLPTPRGGGIAIVITFIIAMFYLKHRGWIDANLAWAIAGGGLIIAAVGYCDDVRSIKARFRILLHFLAAAWAVYWLGGFPILILGSIKFYLHAWGIVLAVIGIVWCINLYNFMDGIDGLAGSEGIFVSVASGIALWCAGANQLPLMMYLLAATIAGFTLWNWPPAKIFLGDVGSGFLGYIFATLGLYTVNTTLLPVSFWIIILAVFLCDSTFTLIYRIIQRKQWYAAHREHAYQQLIAHGASHKKVTLTILLFNCCVLFPIAMTILFWPSQTAWVVGFLLLGLCVIWASINFINSRYQATI